MSEAAADPADRSAEGHAPLLGVVVFGRFTALTTKERRTIVEGLDLARARAVEQLNDPDLDLTPDERKALTFRIADVGRIKCILRGSALTSDPAGIAAYRRQQ